MTKTLALTGMIVLAATAVGLSQGSQAANESLWEDEPFGPFIALGAGLVLAGCTWGSASSARESHPPRAERMAGVGCSTLSCPSPFS